MVFRETPVAGARLIDLEKRGDDRGFFARVFCRKEMANQGLVSDILQINTSLSVQKGTLRGMHYQLAPSAEVKIVRCIRGALFDVVLDLRPDSPSFCRWFGAELSAENRTMMYVPKGCAHGFLTLEENTEAFYLVDSAYAPDLERGVRYDDLQFGIVWPAAPAEVSQKDRSWPDFDPAWHGVEQLRGLT
ncbi:dTDP-4-dehydrorhamnose 3,5-epimerase [Desulfovibrio sp. DV]|uniref:dTDP-4-dehydrorhamnose 3,5-epimerase n=1 Tax=Desulfovibrio sp. DV TaxID=1844708 RepID=UPI00094BC15A|nr:dTDP-4-dehydrorhamnose 3,5-epimerase [Desulfovibrio sp. DV]OLN24914.1 dTDP-4-dehydrorhamnose 3,5-epimerase [Desulfovibrio sp. DV]